MLPVGADSESVCCCCYSFSRTKREDRGTSGLFAGAMANAIDMKTRDHTWHFFGYTEPPPGSCFCSDTDRRQHFRFWLCTTSLGGEMDGRSLLFHFGVIAKAVSTRQYAQGELI